MDILDIIRDRRSVRKFIDRPVPEEMITSILDAGRWAPSGLNNQPWRFAVISDSTIAAEISRLTHYSRIVLSARVLIAVFLDTERSYHREKDIQAIGACLQNMLIEAHSLGLGAVWLGEIIKSNDEMKKILNLDKMLELMAVVALGFPAEKPKATSRKELKELIVFHK